MGRSRGLLSTQRPRFRPCLKSQMPRLHEAAAHQDTAERKRAEILLLGMPGTPSPRPGPPERRSFLRAPKSVLPESAPTLSFPAPAPHPTHCASPSRSRVQTEDHELAPGGPPVGSGRCHLPGVPLQAQVRWLTLDELGHRLQCLPDLLFRHVRLRRRLTCPRSSMQTLLGLASRKVALQSQIPGIALEV